MHQTSIIRAQLILQKAQVLTPQAENEEWPLILIADSTGVVHIQNLSLCTVTRVQELCESWGGHPGLPNPNKPYGFCACRAKFEDEVAPWPNFTVANWEFKQKGFDYK